MHAHHDSPGPEWYEPADLLDDVDPVPAPEPAETLHVAAGAGSWTRSSDDD